MQKGLSPVGKKQSVGAPVRFMFTPLHQLSFLESIDSFTQRGTLNADRFGQTGLADTGVVFNPYQQAELARSDMLLPQYL